MDSPFVKIIQICLECIPHRLAIYNTRHVLINGTRVCVARSGVLTTVAEVAVAPAVVVVTCHPKRQRDSGAQEGVEGFTALGWLDA